MLLLRERWVLHRFWDLRSASSCCRSRMRCVASMDSRRAFPVPLLQPLQMACQVLLHREQGLGSHLKLPGVLPVGEPPVEPPAVAFPLLGQQVDQKAVFLSALGVIDRPVHLHIPLFRRGVVQGHDLFKGQEQNLPALGAFPQIPGFPPQDVQREERQHPGKRSAPGGESHHDLWLHSSPPFSSVVSSIAEIGWDFNTEHGCFC